MKVLSPPPITWSALSLCLTIQITPFFTWAVCSFSNNPLKSKTFLSLS
jgi:hypothetical protein